MAKEIAKLKCLCGYMIPITEEDLGFDEMECPDCECTNYVPETVELIEEFNKAEGPRMDATHVRIMARGEDGHEWCLKNGLAKDNDCYELIIAGAKACYPEATVWVEDEEATNPNYMKNMLRELDGRDVPLHYYDEH